mmetsp:Transcript_36646/g.103437  ORF Transcript_36646/g.103437 Transcript_36646/m.103437 type:complete len:205 (-) Transcript_36646:96-710(-)|eukprot:CAMPEP_0117675046 /NCGR_PEP_ID=MMETSP0804-20121206/15387_1 /TAXON_ID=1074897 /ORGANISM="Tetraselmis astigmatica, Strain CCMP880" /LENGTH=204 /DNA_ID=CAMNT_0005484005 /DNA_START=261 /DNA_END=875 /DNA_ORIENTATION=+
MWQASVRGLRGLWGNYQKAMDRHPVKVQMATSAALWAIGDTTAQRVEKSEKMDWKRTGLTAIYGAGFLGPAGHFWYSGLDKVVGQQVIRNQAASIACKVAADSLLFGPVHVAVFFLYMNMVQGSGWDASVNKLRQDFVPTFIAELGFWPIVQSVNFWKVPVEHQLLAVNCACVLESTFLCWARSQDNWTEVVLRNLRPAEKGAE